MATIINLTPHPISLSVDGVITTFPASGTVARVAQTTTATGRTIAGAVVSTSTFGDVTGIPDADTDTYFIVSGLVLSALAGKRTDVIAPKTDASAIRNDAGHIVAVTGWLV
jgi:hypothetical protein